MRGRKFIWLALALAAAWFGAQAFWFEPRRLTVTDLHVRTPSWPAGTRPLRAVLLSDFHIGGSHMPPARVREIAAVVNALKPDVILLGGDYIGGDGLRKGDERLRRNRHDEYVQVDGLKALDAFEAPLGVIAVMGNHDCHWDCDRVREVLKGTHVQLLENTALPLRRPGGDVWIEGIEDGQTQKPDFPGTAAQVPKGAASLVLVHNAGLFDWAANHSRLQLSGHTHAGQVRLPLIGAPVRMSRHTEDTADGWAIYGDRILIVTRGLGESGFPVRLNAPPQIMVLTIRPGQHPEVLHDVPHIGR